MGKLKNGIFSSFTGKLGPIIGSMSGDECYIRSVPHKYKDAKSEEQLFQRSAFRVAQRFVRSMTSYVRSSYDSVRGKMSAFNMAMRHVMLEAIVRDERGCDIDYSKVLVADGRYPMVSNPKAEMMAGKLLLTWEYDPQVDISAHAQDRISYVVYNINKETSTFRLLSSNRSELSVEVDMYSLWRGDDVAVYIAAADMNGEVFSKSTFLGIFRVEL